ncbi:MAG: hypothetical protein KF820_07020 [Candidatus Paracaedibacteraceae bacterium]|nr:hypothetical protein [Candidatus Paracaedibacteraceae bacterium]
MKFSSFILPIITLFGSLSFAADDSKQYQGEPYNVLRLSPAFSNIMQREGIVLYATADKMLPLAQKAFDEAMKINPFIERNTLNHSVLLPFLKRQQDLFGDAIQLSTLFLEKSKNDSSNELAKMLFSVSLYRYGCIFLNLSEIVFQIKKYDLTVTNAASAIEHLQRSLTLFNEDSDQKNAQRATESLSHAYHLKGVALLNQEEGEKDTKKSLQYYRDCIDSLYQSFQLEETTITKTELIGTIAMAASTALTVYKKYLTDSTSSADLKSENLDNVVTLITLCQSIPFTQPIIEIISPSPSKRKSTSKLIDLEGLKCMIVSLNCRILLNAENTEKAEELYKKFLYDGKYADAPEMESKFITANLEFLKGNSAALRKFYREQRIKRHIARIRARQSSRPQTETAPQHHGTPITKQPKPTPSYADSETSYSLSLPKETYSRPTPKKEKVKTRGIAKPPVAIQHTENIDHSVQEEPTPIILSKTHYNTFAQIVIEHTCNISLNEVKQLLLAFGCTISKTQGKGVHQKITAPNGNIWTAPQDWGNRIPDYYRLQLASFILDILEIEPDNVVKKNN